MKKADKRSKGIGVKRKRRRKKQYVPVAAIVFSVIAILALSIWYVAAQKKPAEAKQSTEKNETSTDESTITHNGVSYKYNRDLKTLLFMGIDKRETELSEQMSGRGGQADCIILFIIDPNTQKVSSLQISRDTMTDVDIYDINGEKMATEKAQITLQYAYGDGRTRSCRLMKDSVSRLLYGVEIDSYFAMNLEGFSTATDLVGGVELTIPEDYTDIDPAFQKGATVTLDGELARKYVQTRDIEVLGSNDDRMERQAQFMEALAQKMMKSGGNSALYTKMYLELQDYIVTDVNADDLAEMSDYEFTGVQKVPGETRAGEAHDEYYVDEDALYELILELFYVPADQ